MRTMWIWKRRGSWLKVHMSRQHNELGKTYDVECPYCPSTFANLAGLNRHIYNHKYPEIEKRTTPQDMAAWYGGICATKTELILLNGMVGERQTRNAKINIIWFTASTILQHPEYFHLPNSPRKYPYEAQLIENKTESCSLAQTTKKETRTKPNNAT